MLISSFHQEKTIYPNHASTNHTPKAGVSNSTYLGAAGGRVWVRLGHIKYSTENRSTTDLI